MKTGIWFEDYRPREIDACVLSKDNKALFNGMVEAQEIPNMIFAGPPGVGKTTVARCLARQLDSDMMIINGSENGGIDIVRNQLRQFASNCSMSDAKHKTVIFDEGDYLNCVSVDESVLLSDGSSQPLIGLSVGDELNVLSMCMKTGEFEPDVAVVLDISDAVLFRVNFDDGTFADVTDEHPFICKTDSGFIERTIKEGLDEFDIVKF